MVSPAKRPSASSSKIKGGKAVTVKKPQNASFGLSFKSLSTQGSAVTITKVLSSSPLHDKVALGQQLVAVNGNELTSAAHAKQLLATVKPGETVTFEVCDNPHVTVVNDKEYVDKLTKQIVSYRGLWNTTEDYATEHGTALFKPPKNVKDIDTDKLYARYDGYFLCGYFHGEHNRLQWSNGDIYEGGFRHSKRSGYGIYQFQNGNRLYTGQFITDDFQGWGTLMYPGRYYQGKFDKGEKHGIGRLVFHGGKSWYQGSFDTGLYDGEGVLVLNSQTAGMGCHDDDDEDKRSRGSEGGVIHVGGFKNGLYDGPGIQFSATTWQVLAKGSWSSGKLSSKEEETEDTKNAVPALIKTPKLSRQQMQVECKVLTAAEITDDRGDKGLYTGIASLRCGEDGLTPSRPQQLSSSITSTTDDLSFMVPHGYGRMEYKDGSRIHSGFWNFGKKEGYGKCIFLKKKPETEPDASAATPTSTPSPKPGDDPDSDAYGDVHEGWYHENSRHGTGEYRWVDGRHFKGTYKDDLRHGHGDLSYPNGDVYRGEFAKGQRSGMGRFDFGNSDGKDYYVGSWLNGKYHGQGELHWKDSIYVGEFENGVLNGTAVQKKLEPGENEGEYVETVVKEGKWEQGKFVGP